jgi:hypothetical protein
MTVAKELSKYNLDLVRIQVTPERSGTESAGEYAFFYGKGNENHELGTGFCTRESLIFVHNRIISSAKGAVC